MTEKERVHFQHFWEHILWKQLYEIEERYYGRRPLPTELYEELLPKFDGKIVVPFADFSVTTACTLKCKYCSQWMPYLKKSKVYSVEEIKESLSMIFKAAGLHSLYFTTCWRTIS